MQCSQPKLSTYILQYFGGKHSDEIMDKMKSHFEFPVFTSVEIKWQISHECLDWQYLIHPCISSFTFGIYIHIYFCHPCHVKANNHATTDGQFSTGGALVGCSRPQAAIVWKDPVPHPGNISCSAGAGAGHPGMANLPMLRKHHIHQ